MKFKNIIFCDRENKRIEDVFNQNIFQYDFERGLNQRSNLSNKD